MYKRTGGAFALIALMLGGCIYFITTGKYLLGIDLRGGTELVYRLDLSTLEGDPATVAETVKQTVAERLDIYGLKEISIAVQGTEHLVVQVPGAADSEDVSNIRRQVEEAGNLEFMLVAPEEHQTPERIKEIQAEDERYQAALRAWIQRKREHDSRFKAQSQTPPEFGEPRPEAPEFIARPYMESEEVQGKIRLKPVPNQFRNVLTVLHNGDSYKVSGSLLIRAVATYDQNGRPAVAFGFNQEGANKFANLTGPHIRHFLAIVLDEKVRQVARIQSRIYDSGELTGNFSRKEVQGIVTLLKGGSLKAKPQLISESTVGAVLGNDSIQKGAQAVVIGLLAVFGFMAVYYLLAGLVANVALVFNVIIILAFVVVFRQTLTFPGIAGILLTIAMAIDANILIFERVREELARGKSLLHAIGAGYDRAFWVIFDSNITTILSGVVLFELGSGPVKGFAVTLIAGLVASFFTAVFVTRVIFSFLYNAGLLRRIRMMKVFSPPRVDYVGIQKWFVGASVIIIAGTWMFFVIPRGQENYGIDFTGGSRITMNLNREISVSELRDLVANLPPEERGLFKDYSIQTLNASKEGLASSFTLLTRTEENLGVARALEASEPLALAEPAGGPADPPAIEGPAPVPNAGEAPKAAEGPKATDSSKPAEPAAPAPAAAGDKAALPPAAAERAPAAAERAPAAAERAPAAGEKTAPAEAPPGAAPPAPPAVAPPIGTTGLGVEVVAGTAEARRQAVLRAMLERAGLLLPPSFSPAEWQPAEGNAQRLLIHANVLKVEPEFNVEGLPTAESIQRKLNNYFERHPTPSLRGTGGAEPTAFPGIRIEKVETAPAPAGSPATMSSVTTYRVTARPYVEPPLGSDPTTATAPRHMEVEAEIKKWFRTGTGGALKLSEPFPEVFSVGPKVAQDLQASAVLAVFVAMIGIMFYMALRFELMYGIAGIVALAHDVLITIGFMALTDTFLGETFSVKINLPEIAAFLTIIGFSINDTIVVFDRIREMLKTTRRKLTYREVVNAAVNQTMVRTIWTSLTTLIVTVTLLLWGGEPIRGFAYAFAIGVVTGCYSSVFIANPLVVWLHDRQVKRKERLLAEAAAER